MLEICPACEVSIDAQGKVYFSVGQPGTRAKLYARVCKFNQKPGCINQSPELIGEVTAGRWLSIDRGFNDSWD